MTLYMIGLGLNDANDISLKGLEAIRQSDNVFLEHYTGVLQCGKDELEKLYGKKIILADRDMVESNSDIILAPAVSGKVSFIVVGDPFGATTHSDLLLRARKKKIDVKIIHNASIMNSVAETGLELYKFGPTTSIVFDDDNWLPETPYNVIKENQERGLHTLCLLDIKVAEPSRQNLLKGIKKPEPPRFMTVTKALQMLRKLEDARKEKVIHDNLLVAGIARLGSHNQKISFGKLSDVESMDFGGPLHCLVIPGKLNEIEKEIVHFLK